MDAPSDKPIVVVGAGVFGLLAALTLAQAGLPVRLFDGPDSAPSASAVAAGMLAPTSECLFDCFAAPHQALLMAARDVWPRIEGEAAGLRIDRSGVMLAHSGELIQGDWRIADVPDALAALRRLFLDAGGQIEPRRFTISDHDADQLLILAPGAGAAALSKLAPELAVLNPIKGQIARLDGGPTSGPVLRWDGGYLAPHPDGALAGATMEPGLNDLSIDKAALAALRDRAAEYAPQVAGLSFTGMAGVRMSSPDGLPLVGPSATPSVLVAAGARRNGWLLAPLVGHVIAAYVTGADPGPWASALHPGRFTR